MQSTRRIASPSAHFAQRIDPIGFWREVYLILRLFAVRVLGQNGIRGVF
jgi:hypothetical protein